MPVTPQALVNTLERTNSHALRFPNPVCIFCTASTQLAGLTLVEQGNASDLVWEGMHQHVQLI